jgi:hypothetical protein
LGVQCGAARNKLSEVDNSLYFERDREEELVGITVSNNLESHLQITAGSPSEALSQALSCL